MPQDTALISTLAVSLAFALVGGYVAARLRLPPLVGYLVAGIAVGPLALVSAALAQIGEFSFILAGMGVSLGILPPEGRDLILATALISIALNPLVFLLAEKLRPVAD